MPTNIEIKARAREIDRQRQLAVSLCPTLTEVIRQVDTFFNVPIGRLKLREFDEDHGQLIQYLRDDMPGPKESNYLITVSQEPARLRAVLSAALGIRGEVRKTRTVYRVGQTRIHFDEVEQLGSFIELEVVLQEGQSHADGQVIANALMQQLDINAADLIDAAYIDLLDIE